MKGNLSSGLRWLIATIGVQSGLVERFSRTRRSHGRWCRILRFHRVIPDDEAAGYYRIGLSSRLFGQMMRALASSHAVISLEEFLQRRAEDTPRQQDSVVLTFDDGYLDNLTEAVPILKSLGLPAIFYVSAACLNERMPFWPELLAQVLRRTARASLEVELPGEGRLSAPLGPPDDRGSLCLRLIRELRTRSAAEISSALTAIAQAAEVRLDDVQAQTPPIMGARELKALVAEGFQIGSHTVTHPYLPAEDEATQRWELTESRRRLEQTIGAPVLDFCYPGGGNSERTRKLVREAGYRSAVSTRFGIAGTDDDPLLLPRVGVGEGLAVRPGRQFSAGLLEAETSGWLAGLRRSNRPSRRSGG